MTVLEKVLRKVKVNANGCFEWQAGRNIGGYGRIGLPPSWDVKLVHRVMFEIVRGPIPAGLFVCHHCDNPPCCNPAHLFLGTAKDNSEDASKKDRISFGENSVTARLNKSDALQAFDMYDQGMSIRKIATHFGVHRITIQDLLTRRTWKRLPKERIKSRTTTILNEKQVAEIRQRLENGEIQTRLAKEYGVKQVTISAIKTRRLWKHVG